MKKINKYLSLSIIFILLTFSVSAENKIMRIGNENAKINIKVFSSLTCPHCANFHIKIFESLKKDYIDKDLVLFEHIGFPLDLAALNADIIVRCHPDKVKSFQLLGEIYRKQSQWAVGSDINVINDSLKKIGVNFGLDNKKMDNCLIDDNAQEEILNERIEAQKEYNIQSTPTIYINEKKYAGEHEYNSFKKIIDKLL